MRPHIALYVGGMGSRERNFYNQLVQRYGFEAEAKQIQDLFLEGKREEAMAAIPDELIDTVALCGPPTWCASAWRVYRDAGVGTLGVTPVAFTVEERLDPAAPGRRARRRLAMRVLLGAFGDPGHAFPMIALGRSLVARGHDVTLQTWTRWQQHVRAEGMTFSPAPEYAVLPHRRRRRRGLYEAVAQATTRHAAARALAAPDVAVADILTLAPALAAEIEGVPCATLIPHVYPDSEPGFPIYSIGARLPRTGAGRWLWRRGQRPARRGLEIGRRELNAARAQLGLDPLEHAHGGISRRAGARRDVSPARVSAHLARARSRRGSADVGAAGGGRRATAARLGETERRSCWSLPPPPRTPSTGCCAAALRGLAGTPRARARDLEPRLPPRRYRARQREARRLGLLLAHDAPLRRRRLPRRPWHARARAGLRLSGRRRAPPWAT